MTAHAHRAPFHPFDRRARRPEAPTTAVVSGDHAPEVLLSLAALLVVLAGPVARTVAPDSAWVAAGSALLLVTGVILAAVATWQLLRTPAG